jgi:hypothetical protein
MFFLIPQAFKMFSVPPCLMAMQVISQKMFASSTLESTVIILCLVTAVRQYTKSRKSVSYHFLGKMSSDAVQLIFAIKGIYI